jgi:dTDP-4-dehydrorhamnose 3,5-epimerase
MQVRTAAIPEIKLMQLTRHADRRGFVSETYKRRDFVEAGIDCEFVQDNHTLSVESGVVRGLHFQIPPFAQAKLIRVVRGRIFDVAVDIRHGSPSFGRHVAIELSSDDWNQIFVPAGFAHGFCTLEPNTEVLYKLTSYYSPAHDRGLLWNDPALAIEWPVDPSAAVLSEKDKRWPRLSELPEFFRYSGEERAA